MKDWSRIVSLAVGYEMTGSYQEIDDDGNDLPDTGKFLREHEKDVRRVQEKWFDVLVKHFEGGN